MRAAYEEKRRYAMQVVYTSDLHGNPDHYTQVVHLAAERGARAIILGGDLFPNSHEPARGLTLQREFVHTVFGPWLRRIHTHFRALTVYALHGCTRSRKIFTKFVGINPP